MWKKRQEVQGVKTLQVQQSFSEEEMYTRGMSSIDHETEIKYYFAQMLARKIMEDDLFEMYSDQDAYTRQKIYRAEINVTEPSIKKAVVDSWVYEVQGIAFTHKDIEKAVKNWKPEMFL